MARRGSIVGPWLLVAVWCCVIWGHSLVPGVESGMESAWVVQLVRDVAAGLYASDNAWVHRLVVEHPGILSLLQDSERLSFYVRKAAHFSEYFVLGILVLRAVRRTLRSVVSAAWTLCSIWALVPGIDESIQRFVPGRAGMLRDVLIDMSGFGTAVVLGLPIMGLLALVNKRRMLP